jgi:two-component system sensor histidine kinase/response regulator
MEKNLLLQGKTILVVDDNEDNRQLLKRILKKEGYNVRLAADGESAIMDFRKHQADIILLDIQMPGTDGFEVCRAIKADNRGADIPILFMSAADDIENITRGFELGAIDFIPKPYHAREISARVRNHLMARIAHQQLVHLARQQSIGYLVMGLAHEVNTPLGTAVTALSIASEETRELESRTQEGAGKAQLGRISESLVILGDSLEKLRSLLGTLDDLNLQQGDDPAAESDIGSCIEMVMASFRTELESRSITVETEIDAGLSAGIAPRILVQIITSLIQNVIHHAFPEKCEVEYPVLSISAAVHGQGLSIAVRDNGVGIDEAIRPLIYEPFVTTKRTQHHLGMGMYMAHSAISAAQGSVSIQSQAGEGTEVLINLPRSRKSDHS